MAIRIVRLGTTRHPDEGVRLGTVRRPPRGVRKHRYARDNWYDVWLPVLSPSAGLISSVQKSLNNPATWRRFTKRYESEMSQPNANRVLDTLAALSHQADFSVGCYCENEQRCHRSILRRILKNHGAKII